MEVLVQGRWGDTFGAFVVDTGVAGLALGVAALPMLGIFVCVGIGFHRSRVWQISSWCSSIVCQVFGWWGMVSVCACAFQCRWYDCSVVGLGSLGMTLGVFLVHCVLCCVGDFDSACWRELIDDDTSSRYIFLFMFLLIPFLVIGLSIKANISVYQYMIDYSCAKFHRSSFFGFLS